MTQETPNQPVKPRIISDWDEERLVALDKRHLSRMALVQALFVAEFPDQSWPDFEVDYEPEVLAAIQAHQTEYDQAIQAIATERPLSELAKTDLVILRLILHESKTKKTPIKVLIDEGVELAKDFGGEHSYAFVNAVLEKLLLKSEAVADTSSDETTIAQT
jgi:N utilization substance protein B